MGTHRVFQFVCDILFPVECVHCGAEGQWLCDACCGAAPPAAAACPGCRDATRWGECCSQCQPDWALRGVAAATEYHYLPLQRAIRLSKYQFSYHVASALGDFFARRLRSFGTSAPQPFAWWQGRKNGAEHPAVHNTLIVPVALAPRRLRWRGFNQSQSIAYRVAEACNLDIDTVSLRRVRYRRPQAGLSEAKRWSNVAGSFLWRGEPLNGRAVTLVDDVVTTAATMEAAARALKAAGARDVWGIAVARG